MQSASASCSHLLRAGESTTRRSGKATRRRFERARRSCYRRVARMDTLTLSLYIGIGGFFGAVARYLLSRAVGEWFGAFPFGTLLVNVTGSFALGVILYGVAYGKSLSPEWRSLWTIGFIGAFTT